jgi:hypothetical protein
VQLVKAQAPTRTIVKTQLLNCRIEFSICINCYQLTLGPRLGFQPLHYQELILDSYRPEYQIVFPNESVNRDEVLGIFFSGAKPIEAERRCYGNIIILVIKR